MTRFQRSLAAASFALVFAAAFAAEKTTEPRKLTFLKPDAVDVIALLPLFPIAGTEEGKSELALVVKAQATRTAADVERVKADKKISLACFTSVLGPSCTEANLPLTTALLHTLEADSKHFINEGKLHFQRPRPALADPHLSPLIEEKDESYPSGHSTRGSLFAYVLAEICPDRKDALIARGQELGWDRIVAGVHYPSDIYAGRTLGKALARALLDVPAFREKLAAARAEIEAVRTHHASAAVPSIH